MAVAGSASDHSVMSDRGLHYIEDDLGERSVEDWAGAGVNEIEAYLEKHAAFLSFLDSQPDES
jgi:hypothetical protein